MARLLRRVSVSWGETVHYSTVERGMAEPGVDDWAPWKIKNLSAHLGLVPHEVTSPSS